MAWQTHRQLDFTGGENRKVIPSLMEPTQLVRAQNCVYSEDGVLLTRYGKGKVNTDSLGTGAATSVHLYSQADGDNYILVQWTTKLYAAAWNGVAAVSSLTEIKSGLNAAKLRSVVWKDKIILTNGADNVFSWDGTTVADLSGSPPKSYLLAVYSGRLFLVDAANPNQVRYSDLESIASFPALNVIYVRDNDGDYITALSPQAGGLVIGKTCGMFTLYGTNKDNFRLSDSFSEAGPIGYDCTLDAGIFMGRNNWFAFTLGQVTELPPTHTTLLDAATVAEKAAAFSATQTSTGRHFFSLGSNIVVFDQKNNAITSWTGLNQKSFCVADAEGFQGDLLIGDATIGRVYKMTGADDDGTAISTLIKTAYYDYGSEQDKEWRYFWPDVDVITASSAASYNYAYDVDFEELYGTITREASAVNYLTWDTDKWDIDTWGDSETYNRDSFTFFLHNVRGRYISHELRSTTRLRFKGFSAKWRLTGRI